MKLFGFKQDPLRYNLAFKVLNLFTKFLLKGVLERRQSIGGEKWLRMGGGISMREGCAHKACSFKRSPFFSLQSSSPSREERSSLGGELRYLEGLQKFFHFFVAFLREMDYI